ncbi:MAG: hypothetical protein KDC38_01790 [Planctomycetes bacterium]|nr:hypothetical protein [Planctomycetota bacterium]
MLLLPPLVRSLGFIASLWLSSLATSPTDIERIAVRADLEWIWGEIGENPLLVKLSSADEFEELSCARFATGSELDERDWLEWWVRTRASGAEALPRPIPGSGSKSGGYWVDLDPGRYLLFPAGFDGDLRHRATIKLLEARTFALIVHRLAGGGLQALTVDATSLEPLAGVDLRLVDRQGSTVTSTATDSEGNAVLDGPDQTLLLISRHGEDVRALRIDREPSESRAVAFVSTDRPIYRPGDRIHFKVVCREWRDGRLRLPLASSIPVTLEATEDRVIQTLQCEIGAEGTAHGELRLAPEARSGPYRLATPFGACDLWVQPFRKPEFGATLRLDTSSTSPAIELEATYAFGGPVAGATVAWTAFGIEPPPWRRGFDLRYPRVPFEDPHGWVYDIRSLRRHDSRFVATARDMGWLDELDEIDESALEVGQFFDDLEGFASGEARLDQRGRMRVKLPDLPRAAEKLHFVAEIVDGARYAYPFRETFDLGHREGVCIDAGFDDLYLLTDRPARARCRVTDGFGKAITGAEVDLALLCKEQVDIEGDPEIVWEWQDGGRTRTDADGYAELWVTPRPALEPESNQGDHGYRLRARLTENARVVARVQVPVYTLDAPPGGDEELELIPDRRVYEPGQTMRLLVRSGTRGNGWLIHSNPRSERLEPISLDLGAQVFEVPYRPEWGSSAHVGVLRMDLGTAIESYRTVYRAAREERIDIDVGFDAESYRPGDRAQLSIATTRRGEPVEAELEIALVDESIFRLREHRPVDPSLLFAQPRALGQRWESPWTALRRDYDGEIVDDESEGSGHGLFFDEDDDAEPAEGVRRNFVDTWHWSATARTDATGALRVDLPVPDDLTEWRVVVRAVSGDDGFGMELSETRTRQPVFGRLVVPTPLRQGDEVTVSAIVHNHLAVDAAFDVELTVAGAAERTDTGATSKLDVRAGESARLDFPIRCSGHGEVRFDLTVRGSADGDHVRLVRDVQPIVITEFQSAGARLDEEWRRAFEIPADAVPGSVELVVTIEETPLDSVAQVLPSLMDYPYGCVEQTMSRFLPTVIARDAAQRVGTPLELPEDLDAMIRASLDRLTYFQHVDGGWGWWRGDETNLEMSRYVLMGLLIAHSHGIEVEPRVITAALRYVGGDEWNAETLHILRLARDGGWFEKPALADFADFAPSLAEAIAEAEETAADFESNDTTALCHLILAGRDDLAANVPSTLPTGEHYTDIRDVALRVRAIASVDPSDPRLPAWVEWLLEHRHAHGWNTTLDTAHVVQALSAIAPVRRGPSGVELWIDGEPVTGAVQRVVRSGSDLGSTIEIIARPSAEPGSTRFPPRIHAVLRSDTTSGLAAPATTRAGLSITRTIERLVVDADGNETWNELEPGESIPSGSAIEVTCTVEARGDVGLEYAMIESPTAGGWSVIPDPDELEWGWADLKEDLVVFDEQELDGRCVKSYRARATVPGVYRLPPARVFGMYEPDIEARTGVIEVRVVE